MIGIRGLLLLVIAGSGLAAAAEPPGSANPDQAAAGLKKIESAHLPNAWQVTGNVISGGLPEGDAAFKELAELGVKTVISVDGITPDVELAKKHGLRYVHLPHGYDGIPTQRASELAKAVHDLPGPIYIHCHHGKHRSPAAAAVACIEAGLIPEQTGETLLKLAGTNPDYRGLYEAVRRARPLSSDDLNRLRVEFRERSPIPPLAEAMVELEHAFDRVKTDASGEWKKRDESRASVLLLLEQYKEMRRLDAVTSRTSDFQKRVADSVTAAEELQAAIAGGEPDSARAEKALKKLSAGCAGCHVTYRDNASR